MGISVQPLFQPGKLAQQALGKYLFDQQFTLGNNENARGVWSCPYKTGPLTC